MPLAEEFEDLIIWQQARTQVNTIYDLLGKCPDYAFRDQIQRAAVSVMNNIAEGFERDTRPDFIRFLSIAKGSCGEVRSMLYIAEDRGFTAPTQAESARACARRLSRSIKAFSKSLR